ncbi:hypothetical protein F2Q69_00062533 [Brassica cretica]|uniref:Uncharacterized protein n=1 Tax=Brassica cretica TaxID=69181 RepID=A0A8S9RDS0_BRACR|nr:hypothetical protein F2Q69_00062533 [Brassica cretica]
MSTSANPSSSTIPVSTFQAAGMVVVVDGRGRGAYQNSAVAVKKQPSRHPEQQRTRGGSSTFVSTDLKA